MPRTVRGRRLPPAGLEDWGPADVAPHFDRAESQLRLAGLRYPLPVTADFVSACAQLGYAPAAERQEGYVLARATHRDGLRWSCAPARN